MVGVHITIPNTNISTSTDEKCRFTLKSDQKIEKITEKNSEYTSARYGLGIAYYRAGRLLKAIEQFEKIIRINPQMAMAYYWLGISYRHLGEEEKSIEAYQRLIELSPESEIANYHLATVHMFKKNYRELTSISSLTQFLSNKRGCQAAVRGYYMVVQALSVNIN